MCHNHQIFLGGSSSSNSLRRPLNDNTVSVSNKMRKTTSQIPVAKDTVPTLTISESNRFRQLVNEKKIDLEQLKLNATTLRNELENKHMRTLLFNPTTKI